MTRFRLFPLLLFLVLCSGKLLAEESGMELYFAKPESKHLLKTYEHVKQSEDIATVIEVFDALFLLPRALPVAFGEAGKTNAYYSPEHHAVIVAYELHSFLVESFLAAGLDPNESLKRADEALVFVILHELGHALIGELELPITGREEDCADEFATIMSTKLFTKFGIDGAAVAKSGAAFFYLLGQQDASIDDLHFWDEHSLSQQRVFKILCDLHAALDGGLPELAEDVPAERLNLAVERFPRKESSWGRLLSPYLRRDAEDRRFHSPTKPEEQGHLKLVVAKNTDPSQQKVYDFVRESKALELFVGMMDEFYLWPRDVTVRFEDTEHRQSVYLPEQATLILSSRSYCEIWDYLEKNQKDPERSTIEVFGGVLAFSVIRELGVVLAQELELPWTGEPEDLGDEFTTIVFLSSQGGRSFARDAALFFSLLAAEQTKLDDLDFWRAEHLEMQRVLDILGYLHSQAPQDFEFVEEHIPAHRRARYKRDFAVKKARWDNLLIRYIDSSIFS